MKLAGCRIIARRRTGGRAQYEFYIPQSDGGRLPVEVTFRLVHGADARAYGIITATDISDQKRIQAELRRTNALLLERQQQMERELQLAERVQQSLAPKGLSWSGVSVEAHYQPVSSIGGDYGLVIPGDGRLDVVVCDVSGHGISSALVANRIYSETMSQRFGWFNRGFANATEWYVRVCGFSCSQNGNRDCFARGFRSWSWLMRFNEYRAAQINGAAAPGYQRGAGDERS